MDAIEKVDKNTGEIIANNDDWGADFPAYEIAGIKFVGAAREWRADCKAGIFRIGEGEPQGSKLRMEIMAAKNADTKILGYPQQIWWELLFVDRDGFVSTMLFKGQSVRSFVELMQRVVAEKIPPTQTIITAAMSKRTGAEGAYYVLEFSHEKNTAERVADIRNFMRSVPIPSRLADLMRAQENKDGRAAQ